MGQGKFLLARRKRVSVRIRRPLRSGRTWDEAAGPRPNRLTIYVGRPQRENKPTKKNFSNYQRYFFVMSCSLLFRCVSYRENR